MNEYVAGAASVVDLIFLQDSASTTGGGKTGLVFNTAGLTCYYKRSNGAASVAVTLATITTLGTFNSGGFKEIDATNMPGCYEFHPPNAAFASGAKEVTFFFTGAVGMVPRPIKYRILATNPDDATAGGLGNLDAAVSSRSTYAGADTSGTTTLLGRLTSGRATNLDNLDATVSSRLATAGYTAPDNADILSIKAKTDNLPSAAAGAANGLLINGTNVGTVTLAALTVTGATTHTGNVSLAAGLTITQSTADGDGISVTGNGAGSGIRAVGANGVRADGTTGAGLRLAGATVSGSSAGLTVSAGGVAHGATFVGAGGGSGAVFSGSDTGHGILCLSGNGATGNGFQAQALSTNGDGFRGVATGSGAPFHGDILGNLSGSVGSLPVIATDWISAAGVSAGAVTKIQAGLAVPGSAMTLTNGAITDNAIALPAEAAGRPTTFLAMMRRLFEWAANKRTRDRSSGDVVLRNAADSATLETQNQSTAGNVDTQTKGV